MSVAWRLHDAQFWGVPQRRERVAIVADFGGLSAHEILFEQESMSRNSDESGEARQGTSTGAESGTDRAVRVIASTVESFMDIAENVAPTMKARDFKDPQIILRV